MKRPLMLLVRWVCILVVSFTAAFLVMHFGRRTSAFKQHLYRQLLKGDADQKLHAASVLASVGGESELLRALQEEAPEVHSMARRGLEHMWFYACGQEAYRLMETAYRAAQDNNQKEALRILDGLTRDYPGYAEGWNRRASVLWELKDYARSMADCRQALKLNPNHYGAWQGLGVCHLQLGEVPEACRALRSALKIAPHDEPTQRSLRQCEELLRTHHRTSRSDRPTELL